MRGARAWVLLGLGGVTATGVLIAPFVGIASIDGPAPVFWELRVPRVILAFLAGSALGTAGLAFQAMFRNPLATPFTLGVSSGAALGAAACIRLGWTFSLVGISSISISAFVGALASLFLVYGITLVRRGSSTAVMLLAGVAVSFFFGSVILFIQYVSGFSDSFRIVRWLMGGLETVGYSAVLDLFPFVLSGSVVILLYARELNLLAMGDDLAISRGVHASRAKGVLFVASTLMVGGVVSVCGPIGFIGMMAPHICRLLIGAEHRLLMPATFLFGGVFLVACDAVARIVIAPAEIPVGVVTALLGGPFFVWLLLRRSSSGSLLT